MYELWEASTGNAMGAYDTEEDALGVIRDTVRHYGRQSVATFGLLRINSRGRAKLLAEGEALADRALASAPAMSTPSPGPSPSPASATT
jgi:hypothetical protein